MRHREKGTMECCRGVYTVMIYGRGKAIVGCALQDDENFCSGIIVNTVDGRDTSVRIVKKSAVRLK